LGEGGFGKVVLAKKATLGASDQLVAIKMLKKARIINRCSVPSTITEKQCLILASEHPFITTLSSCFQTKVVFSFF
jgi:serine/threonine protein kinase